MLIPSRINIYYIVDISSSGPKRVGMLPSTLWYLCTKPWRVARHVLGKLYTIILQELSGKSRKSPAMGHYGACPHTLFASKLLFNLTQLDGSHYTHCMLVIWWQSITLIIFISVTLFCGTDSSMKDILSLWLNPGYTTPILYTRGSE